MSISNADLADLLAELGLRAPCDAKDVHKARRRASKDSHPDLAPEGEAKAFLERMKRVNAAADDLLQYCAENGGVIDGADRRPPTQEEQYDFYRDRWQEDETERRARRKRTAQDDRARQEAENARMRREYEEYREHRRQRQSHNERAQQEHERARAAARRGLTRLKVASEREMTLRIEWEEDRARLDAAARAFGIDPTNDAPVWRLYGALFSSLATAQEYQRLASLVVSIWRDHYDVLAASRTPDFAAWTEFVEAVDARREATEQAFSHLGPALRSASDEALMAADQRYVDRTGPSARRLLGAVLEIRRVLGLTDETDCGLTEYWTAPNRPALNLAMGEVTRVVSDKGYAFARRYGAHEEVFVHASSLPKAAFETLELGTVLTFRVEQTAKGAQADDVEIVAGPTA